MSKFCVQFKRLPEDHPDYWYFEETIFPTWDEAEGYAANLQLDSIDEDHLPDCLCIAEVETQDGSISAVLDSQKAVIENRTIVDWV
jgi:hypothetical protein